MHPGERPVRVVRRVGLTGLLLALPGLLAVPAVGSATVHAPADRRALEGPAVEAAVDGGTTDVLLVGDSITQASVGDYGWRYFAWKHLAKVGARVDFVGPAREPHVGEGAPWKPAYTDPDFDQDHAALWGDSFSLPNQDHWAPLTAYRPDVVVLALGTNDVGWWQQDPADVLSRARSWVTTARTVVPSADFVLVEVPWSTNERATRYNAGLPGLATELGTPTSRVVVARAAQGYVTARDDDRTADTWDEVHPNTRGQVKIAAAVTDALAALGVGSKYPRPLVFPAEGPRVVPTLRYRSRTRTATLRWSVPPGATSFDVWMKAPGQTWVRRERAYPQAYPTTTYEVAGMKTCKPYEFRVLARKGWTLAGDDVASPVVTARVGPKVTGRPKLRASTARRKAVLTWPKVTGACTYQVEARFRNPTGRKVVRRVVVTRARAVVRRLPAGTAVTVKVRAVGAQDATRWSPVRTVRTRR